jgi:hypothetical protein
MVLPCNSRHSDFYWMISVPAAANAPISTGRWSARIVDRFLVAGPDDRANVRPNLLRYNRKRAHSSNPKTVRLAIPRSIPAGGHPACFRQPLVALIEPPTDGQWVTAGAHLLESPSHDFMPRRQRSHRHAGSTDTAVPSRLAVPPSKPRALHTLAHAFGDRVSQSAIGTTYHF